MANSIDMLSYETGLAKYIFGLMKAILLFFIIGKIIGFVTFNWWWAIAPVPFLMFISLISYFGFKTESLFLKPLRYIARFVLFLIAFGLPVFVDYLVSLKYNEGKGTTVLSAIVLLIAMLITRLLTGKMPKIPD